MALANKYRPKTFDDVVEQSLAVNILKSMCSKDTIENRNFLLVGPAGTGKAQPLYSKVLTPNGFIQMCDVEVGTEVYNFDGNISVVDKIFYQGERKIYRITLEDHTYIDVADNHINVIGVKEVNKSIVLQNIWTTNLLKLYDKDNIELYIPTPLNCLKYELSHLTEDDLVTFANRCKQDYWRIKSIEFIGNIECQCIYIKTKEKPDILREDYAHCYISDNFIPTHNTTLARIIANIINNGEGEPIEIDAASHSGVDDIREITEQARAYPLNSAYKVYIIDEVHSISSAGFQALLKTLEESPGRSVFILATTNPEKIPETIISRVQMFQLSKISTNGIFNRLKSVLDKENAEDSEIIYDEDAVKYIAKLSYGGMRKALTLTDKVLAYDKHITMQSVVDSLNLPNYDNFFDLISACAQQDKVKITGIIDAVYNSGINFIQWFEEFYSFVLQLVKCVLLQDITLTTIPTFYNERVSKYDTRHINVCMRLANRLVELIYKLKGTQYQQEMALTYLISVS